MTKREVISQNIDDIIYFFRNVKFRNTYVNCNRNSSVTYDYQFFVKVDNKLVMTFSSNNKLENINSDLINEELKCIDYFENIK